MIKSVTVTNYLGESLKLELSNPEKTGIIVKKIEGIGPPKGSINTTRVSSGDGDIYNSARADSRNIVFTFGFMFSPTVEEVRQKTYKYFPIKKLVTLVFEADNRTCKTTGYVESNEPDIFSDEETTQISIVCPSPYFTGSGRDEFSTAVFYGVEPNFEFPFSNESLTEPLIEFGIIQNRQENNVLYEGESETGVIIHLHALGEVRQVTIYNTGTRETMKIDTDMLSQITGNGIINGDEIIISTIKGDKYAQLLREGIYYNILNSLGRNSDWFQLSKGDNRFAFTCEYGAEKLEFKMEFKVLYEGV